MTDNKDTYDILDEASEYTDRTKMRDLLGLVITIEEAKYHEFKNRDGEDDHCFIGTITMPDTTTVEAWLDGAVVKSQLAALTRENRLPLQVKVIRNAEKNGNPYQLVRPDGVGAPAATPAPQETRSDGPQWVPGLQDACSQWLKHNGGASGVSERIFSDGIPAEILTALSIDKDSNKVTGWNLKGASEAKQKALIAALKDDMEAPTTPEELPFE